ncbi:MAG: hypothetical protein JWL87_703 [Candidatus Adlerbacteria bacterium]|nr:hypothetical protein [Candidatus Adlerbacteria bacterium]
MNSSLISADTVYKKTLAAFTIAGMLLASTPVMADSSITVSLSSPASQEISGDFDITATFSADVVDFDASDVHPTLGQIKNFQAMSSSTYTFTFDPDDLQSPQEVHVDISGDRVHDQNGNTNQASAQLSRMFIPGGTSTSTGTTTDNGGGTGTTTPPGGTGTTTPPGDTGTTTPPNNGTSTLPTNGGGSASSTIAIEITSGPQEGELVHATSAIFAFTSTASTTECKFGDLGGFQNCDSLTAGPYGLYEGTDVFQIRGTNLDGASSTVTRTFMVDFPPVLTLGSIATSSDDKPASITFGSSEAGTTTVAGGCSTASTTVAVGTSTIELVPTAEPGTHTCTLTVTDASGGVSNTLTILPEFTIAAPASNNEDEEEGRRSSGGSFRRAIPVVVVEGDSGSSEPLSDFPTVITDTSGGVGGEGDNTSGFPGAGPVVVGGSALAPGEVLGEEVEPATTTGTTVTGTIGAGAAAAGSAAVVPPWAWFLLALILLAALLYWAYRRSVAYETTR